MAEYDKFETLGDAYAKYPQSTLVMRKQYVDEKDAIIADLQKTNATIANNAVTMNRGNPSICVETLEQTFYIPIKLCPMCGRKMEA